MLTGLMLFATIVLKMTPETACARWLDRTLVAALRKITRTHLIFLILMSIVLIAGTELLAIAGPFDMALVVLWDVSAYIDIVVTTLVVAGASRGGAGLRMIVARVLPRRAARARRTRRSRSALPPANDDEDRPLLSVAA